MRSENETGREPWPTGGALVQAMAALLRGPLAGRHTLLAVCPNSEAVTRAALEAACQADAPLLFAATLNQVDHDGGYTGWTPHDLAAFVRQEAARLGYDGPVVLGLDHGGPWKKDVHALADLPYDATLAEVHRSTEACLDAGYGLLHLDPTEDRRLPPGTPVPVEAIVERTVGLMKHAEAYRKARGYPPVAYEVGTEEAGSGLDSEGRFETFIAALDTALAQHALPRPTFVVGDIGTALDTAHFDVERARRMAVLAGRYGLLVKGHYTDGVENVEDYPLSGVGGANVGPGFSAVEYEALATLVRLERKLGKTSGFADTLRQAVVESGRWRKWLRPEEQGQAFEGLAPDRQRWLVETGSRYVWTAPPVVDARRRLYENVAPHRDADAFVRWCIRRAILRFFHAFNLIGFNGVLRTRLTVDG